MAAAAYHDVLQKFYIAYFGRPADPMGLASAAQALSASGAPTTTQALLDAYDSNPTVKLLVDNFGNSAESRSLYAGSSTVAQVTAIYDYVLDRAPDAGGLAYWVGEIDSGRLSLAKVSLAILAAAEKDIGGDALTVGNRLAVGSFFYRQPRPGHRSQGLRGRRGRRFRLQWIVCCQRQHRHHHVPAGRSTAHF